MQKYESYLSKEELVELATSVTKGIYLTQSIDVKCCFLLCLPSTD